MGPSSAKRRLLVYAALIGCALAICGWQAQEHLRFRESAAQALINRGNDITETLRVLVRSQRRFGSFVTKERLEPALADFIRPNELEAIAFLSATGDPVARAGKAINVSPNEIAKARGVLWSDRTLTLVNLTSWDSPSTDDGSRQRPPIIVDDGAHNARPPNRSASAIDSGPTPPAPPGGEPRGRPFGRFMSREEFDAMVQKQGVQSIAISISTDQMRRAVRADLWLRSLVSLLAVGGAVISSLAWRNVGKNAELQIRLVKAGEMNTHLKEMNLAAAGLAHETRNPLNLIRGLGQMIAMEAESAPKLREHAATIVEEADRVTAQLNEFINYSKPREAQIGAVAVQRLVADVARTLLPDIEEKQIQLRQPESELKIEADEQLLRQALFNVLLNAVQAVAPGGTIEVRLAAVGPREAILEIADDGPGVPAENRASIFKPYVTMREKGVGLGLAIVQQITAAHHWEVACLANEPRGALFRFTHLKIAAT
jgi:signal transduction histidine kinase